MGSNCAVTSSTEHGELARKFFHATATLDRAVHYRMEAVVPREAVRLMNADVVAAYFQRWVSAVLADVQTHQTDFCSIPLWSLQHHRLRRPLSLVVETDDDGYIARSVEIPQIFGFGEDVYSAVRNFQAELEVLHAELLEDDNFSDEWLSLKRLLARLVTP